MKGTEHLYEKHLCQECFDLEEVENNQERKSIYQTANDSDRTAFDTFLQQDSVDFSATALE